MSTQAEQALEPSATSSSAEPELFLVRPFAVDTVWQDVAPYVETACFDGLVRNHPEDIYVSLVHGDLQLWLVFGAGIEAVVVTRLVTYPRAVALRLVMCLGEGYSNWVHLLRDIEAWGRAQGATLCEAVARPGWERVLRPDGYAKRHVILERSLDDSDL